VFICKIIEIIEEQVYLKEQYRLTNFTMILCKLLLMLIINATIINLATISAVKSVYT